MPTTAQLTQPRAPSAPAPASDAVPPSPDAPPSLGAILSETLPLAGSVAFYGPPVVLLAGPWTLLGLMLMGPFALLLTFVAAFAVVAALLLILAGALVAAPYLLLHAVAAHRTAVRTAAAATEPAPQRPIPAVDPVHVGLARAREPR